VVGNKEMRETQKRARASDLEFHREVFRLLLRPRGFCVEVDAMRHVIFPVPTSNSDSTL